MKTASLYRYQQATALVDEVGVVAIGIEGKIYPGARGKQIAEGQIEDFATRLGYTTLLKKARNHHVEATLKQFFLEHKEYRDESSLLVQFEQEVKKHVDLIEHRHKQTIFVKMDANGRRCEAYYEAKEFLPVQEKGLGKGPLGRNKWLAQELNQSVEVRP